MASYTDIIPKFNPYISQLPVQAMVEVGMQKQKQYDEGVQRIQQNIQNVAGLEVGNDASRAYLQSKMNELGSKLKNFAAADFSNFQLVNSVSGMTTQLVKDPFIKAGVQSAANIRKQQEFIEKEKEKGNLNPANLTNYQKRLSQYLGAGLKDEEGKPIAFNYEYKQFFDVDKFTKETFDAVKPDGYTYYDMFTTDAKGNKVLSPAMKKLQREGLFPKKVQEVLDQVFSDPRVRQQLAINGEYNFASYDTEALVKRLDNVKQLKTKVYDDTLLQLNIDKAAGKDVDKQIESVVQSKKQLDQNFADLIQTASTNPDAVRGFLQTEDTRDNYLGMYTYIKEDMDISKNPIYEAQWEREKFAADQSYKYYALKVEQQEKEKDRQNARFIASLKATKGGVDTDGDGIPDAPGGQGVRQSPFFTDTDVVSEFNDKVISTIDNYRTKVDELIFSSALRGTGAAERYQKLVDSGVPPTQARARIIDGFAKDNKESPDAFRARWYTKSLNTLNGNRSKLSPVQKQLLADVENAKDEFDVVMTRTKYVDQVQPGDIEKVLKNAKTIEYDWSTPLASLWNSMTGKKGAVKVTPQMQLDMALSIAGDNVLQSKALRDRAVEAKKRLAAQGIDEAMSFTFMNDMIGSRILGKYRDPQEWLERGARALGIGGITVSDILSQAKSGQEAPDWIKSDKQRNSFYNMVKGVLNPQNIQSVEERAKRIREVSPVNPRLEASILTGDNETDRGLREELSGILSAYATSGMNESPNFTDNVGAMTKIASGEGKGSFKIGATKASDGSVTPKVEFYDSESRLVGEVTITEREARALGKDPRSWFPSTNVGELMSSFSMSKNGTTSVSGRVDEEITYRTNDALGKRYFPKLKGTPDVVKGNVVAHDAIDEFGTPYKSYFLYLYVNGDNKEFVHPVGRPMYSLEEANEIMKSITPQFINQLKSQYPVKK